MNRTDRLLAIVLELQGKGWQRAEDLAATFECSRRTIYRDLQALGQAGVPLVSLPGRGYSLMEGYFLPPLSFSTDEATMLLLGSDFMAQHFDAQYRAAAQSAGRKIAGVLPEKLRVEVRELRESIHFVGEGISAHPFEAAKLQMIRRAILARQTVRFRYTARYGASGPRQPQAREADPYALANAGGVWYVSGYCHLRRGVRNFRLDRMDDVSVREMHFTRPVQFQLMRRNLFEPGSYDVRVRFAPEVARWVREAPSFFAIAEEEGPDGGLLVTLHVRDESEILQWLLGWGRHACVLEPESLRQRIAEEAEALASQYIARPVG